jgi:hypothetical protein
MKFYSLRAMLRSLKGIKVKMKVLIKFTEEFDLNNKSSEKLLLNLQQMLP